MQFSQSTKILFLLVETTTGCEVNRKIPAAVANHSVTAKGAEHFTGLISEFQS